MDTEDIITQTATEGLTKTLAPLREVTPVSKYLALVLFIALPFLGAWVGYIFSMQNTEEATETLRTQAQDLSVQEVKHSSDTQTSIEYESVGGLFFKRSDNGLLYFLKSDAPEEVVYTAIPEANPATFTVYDDAPMYARDKNFVYMLATDDYFAAYPTYSLKIITGADPESFDANIVKDFPVTQGNVYQGMLAVDKNYVYYQDQIIKEADPESFIPSNWPGINFDKNHVFLWKEVVPNADPTTYKVFFDTSTSKRGVIFGADADQCFMNYEIIKCEAMPASYEEAVEFDTQS